MNYANNSNNSINNTPPCWINISNETECYCPKDFYGPLCQYTNPIDCTMTYSKPEQCPVYNEDYYVSDYDGDPPCIFVKKDDLIIIKFVF